MDVRRLWIVLLAAGLGADRCRPARKPRASSAAYDRYEVGKGFEIGLANVEHRRQAGRRRRA